VPRIAESGHDLVLIDNRTGPLQVKSHVGPVVKADYASKRGLGLLAECDVIVHLAWNSGVVGSAANPAETWRANVDGTHHLADMCKVHRIPLAFASTLAVVGRPDRLPVTERTPARPIHEYGRQKAAGERIVFELSESGRIPTAIVRMSNVYGTYPRDGLLIHKSNVISLFLQQAETGRLLVNAPGTQVRDFVHIDDVVAHWMAVLRFLRDTRKGSTTVFNCASGESHSIVQIGRMLARLWQESRPGGGGPQIQIVQNPRAALEILEPDFRVARTVTQRLLGVSCRHHVEETIRSLLPTSPTAPRAD